MPFEWRALRSARGIMWLLLGLHLALLLATAPDYFADNDLGFHVSLGRQYGEHGTYSWDHLNWAPTGRPNLQGPALHLGVGLLGRLLGGSGDDYVRAFTVLALLQWAAAMLTAVYFARRLSGDQAALVAAALLSGSVYAAGPFFAGVPSGWIFVLTPWAIHFFLEGRYPLAAAVTAAAAYVHLGGAPAAGLGILLAALFRRQWRGLLITGGLAMVLASPYLVHFVRYLDWYTGRRGHVAGSIAVFLYLLAAAGVIWMLRRPREFLFPLVWLVAPAAWLFQDSLRFFLQATIAAATIAGVFVAAIAARMPARARAAAVAMVVVAATVFPLSIPSLAVELSWALGHRFPRELDWKEARTLAAVVSGDGLAHRIVHSYYDSLSAAMAVYEPRLRQQYGHWGEVRPRQDPAGNVSAAEKVYVLPVPPEDPVMRRMAEAGWLRVHGGSPLTSIVTLPVSPPLEQVAPVLAGVIAGETAWLEAHAFNNRFPALRDVRSPAALSRLRQRRAEQRTRAGRIAAAVLVYAAALEPVVPHRAPGARDSVRAWGSIANFIGDETAMGYLSDSRFERFRMNLGHFRREVLALGAPWLPTASLDRATDRLFREFFEQD